MTGRQFYDWQTAGGAEDVFHLIQALESAEVSWCAIGGVAVNHWAKEPLITRDVDLVVATPDIERVKGLLLAAGFKMEAHEWSLNFTRKSQVSIQVSTAEFYRDFPARAIPADVHGILMRVAALEDTLAGKMGAWRDLQHRQSKRMKDLGDIARLVEAHPHLWQTLPQELQAMIEKPDFT